MRGLMAKPQKSGASGGEIIENPILSNFKEGLSILEYFISTHGARKGLADTALKTADAGYLTRRLVDVAQDVIISSVDCGTLRGLTEQELRINDEPVESLFDRILGRTSVHDILNPHNGELIVAAGEEFSEAIAEAIVAADIETVEMRSVLTCEAKTGVCAKCYGRSLASGRKVQMGEAVGVIAAQSIGEPGTQLTLRTFHVGGAASALATQSRIEAKYDGMLEVDELRLVDTIDAEGNKSEIVIGRSAEMRIVDKNTQIVLTTGNIPYGARIIPVGSHIIANNGDKVAAGEILVKIPRTSGKLGDITGGLPRVTELFEARNPSNPAVVSEIDGVVAFGKRLY
ncbi:unnamed protein product [Rotaria sordida]|uniref:DNA-directed RNA polymerase n=1 Tax=Rotaria sordida TaxID=392033 RepID=A0A813TXS5_9BILA|nr:unnamed protein product [Rotaria sordida]